MLKLQVMSKGQVKEFDSPYNLLQNEKSLFTRMVEKTGPSASRILRQMALDANLSRTKLVRSYLWTLDIFIYWQHNNNIIIAHAVQPRRAFDLNLFMMAKELNFNLVCVIWKFRHGFCICKQSRERGIEATLAMVKSGIKIFARIRPTKKQVGVSCLQDHKIIFDQRLLFHTVCM